MKSTALGRHISDAEVTNISKHGFWLLLADEELFVAFKDFPWFKDASISEIVRVEWPQPHHLYWPDLDNEAPRSKLRGITEHSFKDFSETELNPVASYGESQVDLAVDSIRAPANFPLISKKTRPAKSPNRQTKLKRG